MTSKPHILIIPGMWHVAHHWRLFKDAIENAGYQATVQNLPANVEDGMGAVEGAMDKGVAAIRAAALKLIEKGNDVVVVAHSAVGAAAGGALGGLGKVGSKPGVARIVYLAAFLIEPGVSPEEKTQGNDPPFLEHRDGFTYAANAKEWFYNDVPDDIADNAVHQLVGCSGSLGKGRLQSVCWHEIPSIFILCEKDKALPPAIAEWVIAAAQVSWDVVRMDASHSPFLSVPDRLVAVVRWAAWEDWVDVEGVRFDERKVDAEKATREAGWTKASMAEVDAM